MSGFDVGTEEVMLGWLGPRGVAPKRMPKADATELAPENRHTPLRGSPPEGFSLPAFFGEASRAEALGKLTREMAGLVLPGFRNGFFGTAQKVGHAAAHRLARDLRFAAAPNRSNGRRSHSGLLGPWLAQAHLQPMLSEAYGYSSIQTVFDTHRPVAQARLHAGAIDSIQLA